MTDRLDRQRGFTVIEISVVVLIAGIVMAISAPRIGEAMREYRVNIAMRQTVDVLKRAKMLAISENRRTAIAVDVTGSRAGVVFYNDDNTVNRIEFISFPEGVSFQRKSGVSANPPGVSGTAVVSFPVVAGHNRQDFNSRGFPIVASGASVVSIFIGNGKSYRAITMTSVGGIQTYRLDNTTWVSTR
jgi:prepilin-type N-terminal cleavage/methylation domain-containing protein